MLYGMDLNQTTSVEMLAGYSDGVILMHNNADVLTGNAKRTIDNLTENRVPLFGVAARPPEARLTWLRQRRRKKDTSARLKQRADAERVSQKHKKTKPSKTTGPTPEETNDAVTVGEDKV